VTVQELLNEVNRKVLEDPSFLDARVEVGLGNGERCRLGWIARHDYGTPVLAFPDPVLVLHEANQ
jgi:hypothetical protein